MTERTLAILKPDCVEKRHVGDVLARIEAAGFRIRALKMVRLSRREAEGFYAVHTGKPFFDELVAFMSSGPCVPIVLEKADAVGDFRTLIGATNPTEAAEGTIRRDYADSVGRNIVHGSDSVENGRIEANYFFPEHAVVANG